MAWDTIVKVRKSGKSVEMLINENGSPEECWEPFLVMTRETAKELSEMLSEAAKVVPNDPA